MLTGRMGVRQLVALGGGPDLRGEVATDALAASASLHGSDIVRPQ
jgi:hypothetical protein